MKNIDYFVDSRLKYWASYSIKMITQGLGYPSCSSFLNIGSSHSTDKASRYLGSDEFESIEKCVIELKKHKPEWATSIMICYVLKSPRTKIARYSLTYDQYKRNLQLAKSWLAGAIAGKYY